MYKLHDLQKTPAPIDITIALTWAINKHNSGVYLRYTNHPYLRITVEFDSKGKLDAINVPESIFWKEAYRKLLRYQLQCPAQEEFGMDREPTQYLANFMRRADVLIAAQQTSPVTDLQRHSFMFEQLVGRTGTATNRPLGFPISWIGDNSQLRTLQATARATLPMANPHPHTVARRPASRYIAWSQRPPSRYIDWSQCNAETPEDRLEDNPLGRTILDIFRCKRLQEEIDSKAAAASLETRMDKGKEADLADTEMDLNHLDHQRSEYQ